MAGRMKSIKNLKDSIGNGTHDLVIHSTVPQRTVQLHSPCELNIHVCALEVMKKLVGYNLFLLDPNLESVVHISVLVGWVLLCCSYSLLFEDFLV